MSSFSKSLFLGGKTMYDDNLMHYGTKRHSGRYPWGSGEDPRGFIGHISDLQKNGMSEVDIAKGLGISTTELRQFKSNAKTEVKRDEFNLATKLKEKGYSNIAIGNRIHQDESYVRRLLDTRTSVDGTSAGVYKAKKLDSTVAMLKQSIEEKKYIDVGSGVDLHLGVSNIVLNNAISKLKNEEGYKLHFLQVEQLGTGNFTSLRVLTKGDVEWKEVNANKGKIGLINSYTEDGGRSWLGLEPVKYIDAKRVGIRYAEEGGTDRDGLIEIRRGMEDANLGASRYAQCRIAVEGDLYMKGMVAYADDLPDGVDFRFNTNKHVGTPLAKVLKPMKRVKDADGNNTDEIDMDNPFGATVKQVHYTDKNGKDQLSPMNFVNREGDWGKWSRNIPSQMLSKQSTDLAKKQLNLEYEKRRAEYDSIMKLSNPAVKEKLLQEFSDGCDSAAVRLKAHAMPRQSTHVFLPFPDLKPNEVYAPNMKHGERVVVIRFPHAGQFEIPELTVNNNHKSAIKMIGKNAKDAIGLHPQALEQLSGADCDGDSGLVIPNNRGEIKVAKPLKRLQGFDPKALYHNPNLPDMTDAQKGSEMGKISNLITDMQALGAPPEKIVEAVRHSMVVIDAQKHKLDYKQSAKDHNIAALKTEYQGGPRNGASTLISKATSEYKEIKYKDGGIDPDTGKKIKIRVGDEYIDKKTGKKTVYEGSFWIDKDGNKVYNKYNTTRMAEADNAYELSSGSPMEIVYADYANKMKSLGNESRKSMVHIEMTKYSPEARKLYSNEVESLDNKLKLALSNAPRERQAMILANEIVKDKKDNNPSMEAAELKRLKGQALTEARLRTGASKTRIDISDKEWEAIQSGAVSTNKLKQILSNSNTDRVKELATPRSNNNISSAQISKIKTLIANGYTQADIADVIGVSVSTINNLDLPGMDN